MHVEQLPEAALADTLAQLEHWPLPPRLREGQEFEGWRVEGLLGESRQSLIYRVRDTDNQPWLLKTLPTSRHDEAQAGAALLLEEWFLRRVAGRHFAEAHALPQRQHLYYVQREYAGQTLAEHLRLSGRARGEPSRQALGDEAADVLGMLLIYCDRAGIDLEEVIAIREILSREMPDETLHGTLAQAGLPKGMTWQAHAA